MLWRVNSTCDLQAVPSWRFLESDNIWRTHVLLYRIEVVINLAITLSLVLLCRTFSLERSS